MIDVIMPCYKVTSTTIPSIATFLTNSVDINLILVRKDQSAAANLNEWVKKRRLSEFFVLTDDDVEVEPGWLDSLLECIRQDDSIGAVGPRITWPNGDLFNCAQSIQEGEVSWLSGCLALYRNVGLYQDERYQRSQWNDTDYFNQYQASGYKLYATHKTTIKHNMTAGRAIWTENQPLDEVMQANKALFELKWDNRRA